jgi:hypothetical protein
MVPAGTIGAFDYYKKVGGPVETYLARSAWQVALIAYPAAEGGTVSWLLPDAVDQWFLKVLLQAEIITH